MTHPEEERLSTEQQVRAAIEAERARYIDPRRARAGIAGDTRGTWGLALSGGGIRSATFCLGLVRGLARNGVLKEFDYLSTVSGGGYLGASLGRLYGEKDTAGQVEDNVARDDSMWLWWLRNNGRYLTPAGMKDLGFAAASIVRGIIATHLEIGVLILLAAGVVLLPHVLVSLDPPRPFAFWLGLERDVALGRGWWSLEFAGLAASFWWWLLVVPFFLAVHQMVGYWYTRDRRTIVSFVVVTLSAALAAWGAWALFSAARELYVTGFNRLDEEGAAQKIVFLSGAGLMLLAPVTAWAATLLDWWRGQATGELRLRRTKRLSFAMWAVVVVAAIALLDTLAWWLTARFWESSAGRFPLGQAAVIGLALAAARFALPEIQKRMATSKTPSLNTEKLLNALGVVLALVTLVFWTTLFSIAMFPESAWENRLPVVHPPWQLHEVRTWLIVMTVSALYVVLTCRSFELLNLASLHNFYRARIERAYVSSGNGHNPQARFPDGAGAVATQEGMMKVAPLTEAIAGDDIELTRYCPYEHGGPVHLINCCINQSVDDRTGIYNADRKGVALTVSALGVELGTAFPSRPDFDADPGKLSRWIAISGAAASTGMGSRTSPGFATLLFMSGIRLGYWTRALVDQQSRLRLQQGWLRHLAARLLPKPLAIVAESLARFPGQFGPVWYVSDGGHYDNTGIYALLKRRCRLIVAADCGADPKYLFSDLESLVRKAKIDYGATIEFRDPHQLSDKGSPELRRVLGTPETITPDAGSRWMVVGRICYADGSEGTLVVVKPRRLDQMPFDIVAYADRNPDFPQQTTGDQFFDESQWEAYHQLGVLMGGRINKTLMRNAMTVVNDMTTASSSLISAEASNALPEPRQSRRSRVGLTVGASVGAGLSLSLVLAVWQGIEQYRETRRLEDAQYVQDYQSLKDAIARPETLLRMDAEEFRAVAETSRRRGDGWYAHLLGLVNAECENMAGDVRRRDTCVHLHEKMRAEPPIRRDYWFADRVRIPDHFDALASQPADPGTVTPPLPLPASAPASEPAPAPMVGATGAAATGVPAAAGATVTATAVRADASRPTSSGAAPEEVGPAGSSALPPPAVASSSPVDPGARYVCAASGFVSPRINIHIYEEASRARATALASVLRDDLGLELPPIENVVRSSSRTKRPRPYVWTTPAVIFHSDVSPACAQAIATRLARPDVVVRPLPAAFKSNPGMVEVWIPSVQ